MISILYPEIIKYIQPFNGGYIPLKNNETGKWFFVIKTTKEMILTARTQNEFKVYFLKDYENDLYSLGLITAFFDDHDEPLTLTTPIFDDDELMLNICHALNQSEFDIYFFDELDREIMGISAINEKHEIFGNLLTQAKFYNSEKGDVVGILKRLQRRFSVRDVADDANAFTIKFEKRIYPDDTLIIDVREEFDGFNDDMQSIAMTSLDRDKNPGDMQERDIALLMRRIFDKSEIYVNPYRIDTDKELTDILVVTEHEVLFIQAKDSPNTPKSLTRKIDRKRKTIKRHISKAIDQLCGAMTHAKNNNGISIKTATNSISIMNLDKQLIGLVIVKELFDDEYKECSDPVINLMVDLELPVVLTDYPQLHLLTKNSTSSDHFFDNLIDIANHALERGVFPKIVHTGKA
ncbi:hypothetical protein QGN29_14335 [Temperatibacter marinus]|uniref:NERD domain-containing protein n=1 Tax=Temperatibacter marinus TaxID=1456591 RepID=A0AA52EIL9_9PROT|nr:hypothetical protein [Temperatibacter marinus]WND02726.1 hypothetical protein QGN29_14335 [Temperatibacter marinus]